MKPQSGDSLVFPNFDDIKVSTKTFTATTNLDIESCTTEIRNEIKQQL